MPLPRPMVPRGNLLQAHAKPDGFSGQARPHEHSRPSQHHTMATEQEERVLDVSRESVIRVLNMARKHHDECVERSYAQTWWAGYIRCCEQLLDMENE